MPGKSGKFGIISEPVPSIEDRTASMLSKVAKLAFSVPVVQFPIEDWFS